VFLPEEDGELYSPCGGMAKFSIVNDLRMWVDDETTRVTNGTFPLPSYSTLGVQDGFFNWRRC
jgi:hypothetical protein